MLSIPIRLGIESYFVELDSLSEKENNTELKNSFIGLIFDKNQKLHLTKHPVTIPSKEGQVIPCHENAIAQGLEVALRWPLLPLERKIPFFLRA